MLKEGQNLKHKVCDYGQPGLDTFIRYSYMYVYNNIMYRAVFSICTGCLLYNYVTYGMLDVIITANIQDLSYVAKTTRILAQPSYTFGIIHTSP